MHYRSGARDPSTSQHPAFVPQRGGVQSEGSNALYSRRFEVHYLPRRQHLLRCTVYNLHHPETSMAGLTPHSADSGPMRFISSNRNTSATFN